MTLLADIAEKCGAPSAVRGLTSIEPGRECSEFLVPGPDLPIPACSARGFEILEVLNGLFDSLSRSASLAAEAD